MILPRIIRPNAGFIIPTRRFLDVQMAPGVVGASGRYQLIKRNAFGREIERTPWFDNIILDAGLNRVGTAQAIAGAAIGTGTSAPNASQTGLDTQVHWTTTTGAGWGTETAAGANPYNNTITYVYRTTLGALNGNYTEVGVGWASGSMFSRALILDGVGSPTSISVGSAEQLDIVYQLSIYPPLVDTSNVVTISGVDYTVTGRAANVNAMNPISQTWRPSWFASKAVDIFPLANNVITTNGAIGAVTTLPAGTQLAQGSSALIGAYSNNSMTRSARHTYGLNDSNHTGNTRSVVACWYFATFQYEFNPVLPKNNTKTMTLDFSITWARRP